MKDYEFLSELECFDYLDAMYNDGVQNQTYIEDQLYGVYAETEGERKEGAFTAADEIAHELERTWSEIELLPESEGTWYL